MAHAALPRVLVSLTIIMTLTYDLGSGSNLHEAASQPFIYILTKLKMFLNGLVWRQLQISQSQ
jgi:hypothetical protein